MDQTTIAIVAILALLVVGAMLLYRRQIRVSIRGLFDMQASNESPVNTPAVSVEDAISRGGGIVADDHTGRGAAVRRVDVQDDILASSSTSSESTDDSKKE